MLTDRFAEALVCAENLHRRQTRKGNDIPYVAHLLTVCATVLEWGGDEDAAIAALLHDAPEDQGGEACLRDIEARFGTRVAGIVAACSDSLTETKEDKGPWKPRKQAHLPHLAEMTADTALVVAADKLHNLTAMNRDLRQQGPSTLARFSGTPAELLWYYAGIADLLGRFRTTVPVEEVTRAVKEFAALSNQDMPG